MLMDGGARISLSFCIAIAIHGSGWGFMKSAVQLDLR